MHVHFVLESAALAKSVRLLAKERTLSLSDAIDLHLRSTADHLSESEQREARRYVISALALHMPQRAAA